MTANYCPGAGLKYSINAENPNRNAGIFLPTDGFATPNIGHDMLTQLKPVQNPTFTGNKRSNPSWKAAFMACVDRAPVTPAYKMLQLRQYISGEALNAIEDLGFSPNAYEAAKDRLERKYGGKRRQKAVFMEDLGQFPQIQSGNAEEQERFADLLDITIINLKKNRRASRPRSGSLYNQSQSKLPQSLLARYHRWLFEKSRVGIGSCPADMGNSRVLLPYNCFRDNSWFNWSNPLFPVDAIEREHSSPELAPVNLNIYSHARHVVNNTEFGNVRCLYRKIYRSAGISQKDSSFAIAV